MEIYGVFYTYRHVFNVQYVSISVSKHAMKEEIIAAAQNAVYAVCSRKDTITAITTTYGAYIHVGSGEFQYYGD